MLCLEELKDTPEMKACQMYLGVWSLRALSSYFCYVSACYKMRDVFQPACVWYREHESQQPRAFVSSQI